MTESFAELFEQSQSALSKLRSGAIVTGTIVEIRSDVVVVNAGLKSESFIPIEEFRSDSGEVEVKPGDFVTVAIESIEDGYGTTRPKDTGTNPAAPAAQQGGHHPDLDDDIPF